MEKLTKVFYDASFSIEEVAALYQGELDQLEKVMKYADPGWKLYKITMSIEECKNPLTTLS